MSATNQKEEIDSLRFTKNEDGSFSVEWDPQDPKWSFLNNLTSKEIQIIMAQAIQEFTNGI
jgi:hypothetical protein